MSVAERVLLLDEGESRCMRPRGSSVRGGISRSDHHTNGFDAGAENLFYDDRKSCFRLAISIYQGLKREGALRLSRSGNDCLSDIHAEARLVIAPFGLSKAAETLHGGCDSGEKEHCHPGGRSFMSREPTNL
jgi:hypothetical protein